LIKNRWDVRSQFTLNRFKKTNTAKLRIQENVHSKPTYNNIL
jgi:hypothetical protein